MRISAMDTALGMALLLALSWTSVWVLFSRSCLARSMYFVIRPEDLTRMTLDSTASRGVSSPSESCSVSMGFVWSNRTSFLPRINYQHSKRRRYCGSLWISEGEYKCMSGSNNDMAPRVCLSNLGVYTTKFWWRETSIKCVDSFVAKSGNNGPIYTATISAP